MIMNFKENNKAIYMQIADRIMDDVISGTYQADCRIPSVRDFAANVEVNSNTVMRGYEYLSQEEIIYNKRGLGYFISPDAREKILSMRRDAFYHDELDYFFGRLVTLGVTEAELAEMYKNYKNHK